ncbi:hypothetical protein [Nocardia cyriacigeorgica]|uniref:hypothetical protein n=1 Tax=Nocardia cyriacigeorgica TaxID=135487 RepID=UPI002457943A|nr:hypothetical protein [Nocardia cyriacigeorgica]
MLGGPPITHHTDISARLTTLADAAELAEMAYNSGAGTPPTEHRVLLAADFPHGYQATDVQRLGSLLMRGDLIGLSTVIIGTNESDSDDTLVATPCRRPAVTCRRSPAPHCSIRGPAAPGNSIWICCRRNPNGRPVFCGPAEKRSPDSYRGVSASRSGVVDSSANGAGPALPRVVQAGGRLAGDGEPRGPLSG